MSAGDWLTDGWFQCDDPPVKLLTAQMISSTIPTSTAMLMIKPIKPPNKPIPPYP
jgi:hypothetical protein